MRTRDARSGSAKGWALEGHNTEERTVQTELSPERILPSHIPDHHRPRQKRPNKNSPSCASNVEWGTESHWGMRHRAVGLNSLQTKRFCRKNNKHPDKHRRAGYWSSYTLSGHSGSSQPKNLRSIPDWEVFRLPWYTKQLISSYFVFRDFSSKYPKTTQIRSCPGWNMNRSEVPPAPHTTTVANLPHFQRSTKMWKDEVLFVVVGLRLIKGNWWRPLDTMTPMRFLRQRWPPPPASLPADKPGFSRCELFLYPSYKGGGSVGIQWDSSEQKVGAASVFSRTRKQSTMKFSSQRYWLD